MKFWINAFIPRDIPGYTRVVPKGVHAGKTMIPGPQRPGYGNLRVEISDCYLTDQRGFSNHIHAKSRVHSEFRVDFGGPNPTLSQWHNCDETVECDCGDGDLENQGKGSTSRCRFTLLLPAQRAAVGRASVQMKCASSNPCAPTSMAFGDIDFNGLITVDASGRRIEADIWIDTFPAFEVYATINDGAGVPMLQEMPASGRTVMNLPAGATQRRRYRLEDRNGDAVFETLTTL